jgi:hypothetical protein
VPNLCHLNLAPTGIDHPASFTELLNSEAKAARAYVDAGGDPQDFDPTWRLPFNKTCPYVTILSKASSALVTVNERDRRSVADEEERFMASALEEDRIRSLELAV